MLPSLKIIVYTDCHSMFNENPLSPKGSLSDLKKFTTHKIGDFVDLKFCFVNRHPADPKTGAEIHAGQKVTEKLLNDVDEFWVFGRRKINTKKQPENELDDTEVALLDKWMTETKKGGVFVTGDHSEPDETLPETSCETDHKTFLSLGRALGHRIPRAHQLRDWKGPPTYCNASSIPLEARDNFNTQEGSEPCRLERSSLQYDSIPQTISLTLDKCLPHRLFWYTVVNNERQFITKLPDHAHEGIVLVPDELNSEWPAHSLRPEVVARGRDKRFPDEKRFGGLVTAFDGDSVGIGRIVADSSFHHYLNENLSGIPSRNNCCRVPDPESDLDQIAHFFGNLALWLAPRPLREKLQMDLVLSLSRHADVLEAKDHGLFTMGSVARDVLNKTIGMGRLFWLFGRSGFEHPQPLDEVFSLALLNEEDGSSLPQAFTPEVRLGTMLSFYQNFLRDRAIADVTKVANSPELVEELQQKLITTIRNQQVAVEQLLKIS